MNNKKWEVLDKPRGGKQKDIISILLGNRGIKTPGEIKEFFNPKVPQKLTLKELGISAKEIGKAIKRVKEAVKKKQKIIIYGDYDADGVCATACLWEAIFSLKANVLPYLPERFSEGYGLNAGSIKKLKGEDKNLNLIITVDNGIVANEAVDVAKELGIDVIITDHHQAGRKKPKAFATVHTTKIGGSAVAWVFARELLKSFKTKSKDSLDLVSIGTIADQIPLTGPNRSFARHGLASLGKTKRLGLKALFQEARVKDSIGSYEVGFIIAPRINAAGRLVHAVDSLRLLCTIKGDKALELANHLGKTNLERQRIVEEVVIHAREMVGKKNWNGFIILSHESYHEGVIGLAAGKLVEEFYRPAIVISKKDGLAKGSARSIPGINIIETIRLAEDLLENAGGHPMAAGFSIKPDKVEKFIKRLEEISAPLLTDEVLKRSMKVDTKIEFNQLNMDLAKKLEKFEPVGYGNPTPTFMTESVELIEARTVGVDSKHLKLKLRQKDIVFDAIAFGFGKEYTNLSQDKLLDIAYSLEINSWNGSRSLQLKVKDLKFS